MLKNCKMHIRFENVIIYSCNLDSLWYIPIPWRKLQRERLNNRRATFAVNVEEIVGSEFFANPRQAFECAERELLRVRPGRIRRRGCGLRLCDGS